MKKNSHNLFLQSLICGSIGLFLIAVFFVMEHLAPFGNKSLVAADASIQYMDFFSYLKDVLTDKNSFNYSFSNGLGGSGIVIFSYYLASPINLLVLLFSKSNLQSFYDLAVAIKLSLAIATFSYYLQKRFQTEIKPFFVLLLSLCYGFMQYNIAQSYNIMWLDGVYLLPLILLGVWESSRKKFSFTLAISIGLSIIFNWYTGLINCIFSFFWMIYESALSYDHKKTFSVNFSSMLKQMFLFILAALGGILLSSCVFLPTFFSLKNGARSSLDISLLKLTFNGSILNTIEKYAIGVGSTKDGVALFSGSLTIIFFISYFLSEMKSKFQKIVSGLMAIFILAIIYWIPLSLLFSLMKEVDSYWYRYSYLASFFIIFVAGSYLSTFKYTKQQATTICKAALLFLVSLIVLYQFKPIITNKQLLVTVIGCIITLLLLVLITLFNGKTRYTAVAGLILMTIFELGLNAKWLIATNNNVSVYKNYVVNKQKQINTLKAYDSGSYRLSQTSENLTANYDEGLGYNYWPITSYTSNMIAKQMNLLNILGYRTEQNRMNIVNSPITATDSLLGVKYVLSDYNINGFKKVSSISLANGKSVYKNPYYFPMAFTSSNKVTAKINTWNTFDYTSNVYSDFAGKKIAIYEPLKYKIIQSGNSTIYNVQVKYHKNQQVFGNLTWNQVNNNNNLNINNIYTTGYAKWLSPSLFYIPMKVNQTNINIATNFPQSVGTLQQFYALNLKKIATVTQKIQKQKQKLIFKNGRIYGVIKAKKNTYLYLLVSKDKGWKIKINGKNVQPATFASDFMRLKLNKGSNKISLVYKTPYLSLGFLITFVTLLLLVTLYLIKGKIAFKTKSKFLEQ
jgi:uncharacterized membrane protein YfhO